MQVLDVLHYSSNREHILKYVGKEIQKQFDEYLAKNPNFRGRSILYGTRTTNEDDGLSGAERLLCFQVQSRSWVTRSAALSSSTCWLTKSR